MSAGVAGEGRYIAAVNAVMQQNEYSVVRHNEDTDRPKKAGMPTRRLNVDDGFTVIKKTWLMLLPHLSFLLVISIQIYFQ